MMNEDLHRRLQSASPTNSRLWDSMEDTHLVFIGTFWLGPTWRRYARGSFGDGDVVELIPFEHAYDKIVLDALTSGHRRFVKGLRYNLADDKPLATAVLVDVDGPPRRCTSAPPGDDEEADEVLQEAGGVERNAAWIWRAGARCRAFRRRNVMRAVRYAGPYRKKSTNDEADSAW
ncbi:DUF1173 domain-containing protein (plasmid) [Burkholderia multivorans]|nr:DUF1173 family protein [Burkholderia multivorans]MCO1459932.1 DUF1173 domain-containing protein [Burkholderia multivorans]